MSDLISREELKEDFKSRLALCNEWIEKAKDKETKIRASAVKAFIAEVIMTINNAPTVEPEKAKESEIIKAYTKGFDTGVETVKNERPQVDLIRRSKAIEELNYLKHIGYDNSGVMKLQNMEIQRCISVIEDVPAVEPFERIGVICEENCGYRPQGEWIAIDAFVVKCSVCGVESFATPFCPRCGAKMKGGAE